MGDLGLAPLDSGKYYLIWGVSFSSSGVVSSVGFPIFLGIEDESSISYSISMPNSLSLAPTPSPSYPPSPGLLSLFSSLSLNLWLASLSCLLIFHNSSIFHSSTSLGPTYFCNFSNCFTTLFILLHTTSQLWWLFSSLTHPLSPFLVAPLFVK